MTKIPIHSQIRTARKTAGLSQAALAIKVSLPRTRIVSLESGKCNPTVSTLQLLSEALNCHFEI